jgi:hypothetical protein
MKTIVKKIALLLAPVALLLVILGGQTSCNIYRFKDVSIPDSIKTVKVNFFGNKARYINPQLSPRLSDRLRQKIVSQTRLSQTNNDNADWEVSGDITQYNLTTSAISGQREAGNRLTVGVHITVLKRKSDETVEYDVSRSFEFAATQSLQEAEAKLGEEMIRTLSDDIFNRIFSSWE